MPQLDILLLYSQSVSSLVILIGFFFFFKYSFPFLSFFLKIFIKKNFFFFSILTENLEYWSSISSVESKYTYLFKLSTDGIFFLDSLFLKYSISFRK